MNNAFSLHIMNNESNTRIVGGHSMRLAVATVNFFVVDKNTDVEGDFLRSCIIPPGQCLYGVDIAHIPKFAGGVSVAIQLKSVRFLCHNVDLKRNYPPTTRHMSRQFVCCEEPMATLRTCIHAGVRSQRATRRDTGYLPLLLGTLLV